MSLKKKLTALITMFVLVVVMAIVGVYAVTSATINMGGSISFQASGVYAQLTGGISGGNDKTFNPLLFTEADANSPSEADKETWNNNDLSLTKENPTRTITVTVENLSTERSMYVMIEDVGEVENITKSVTVPGNDNAANKGIEVAKETSVTYTITLSITNTNNSVNGRYEYIIHLSDEPIASKINIQAFSNNEELGTVTGGGTFTEGETVTLTATSARFAGWSNSQNLNDINILSTDSTYSFQVNANSPQKYYALYSPFKLYSDENADYVLYEDINIASLSYVRNLQGEHYTIPSRVIDDETGKEYEVKIIAKEALYRKTELTNLTISEGINYIGKGAFGACSNLQSITFPSTVEGFGQEVFAGCTSLEEFTVSPLNNKLYTTIDGVALVLKDNEKMIAYAQGRNLSEYSIPQGIKEIDERLFMENAQLKKIILPSSLREIGQYAFALCTNITEIIFEEDSMLAEIGEGAFGMTSIEKIELPESLLATGVEAFTGCPNLQEVILPEGIEIISVASFANCTLLSKINLPSTLKAIDQSAFYGCSSLKGEFVIPKSVNVLGAYAFRGCSSLTKVVILGDIEQIQTDTFRDCQNLSEVQMPNTITLIDNNAFRGCETLKSVILPDSLQTIKEEVFFGCDSLVSITINSNVAIKGTSAFWYCDNLFTLKIGKNVTQLQEDLFTSHLDNVKVIKIEEGNTTFSVKNGTNGYGLYKGDELVYSLDSNIVEVGELLYKISGTTGNYQAEVIGAGENITKHINIPSTITSEKFLGETINVISAGDWNHNLFIESITIENGVKRFFSRYCRNLFKITLLGDLEQGWSPQTFYSDGEWYKDDIKVTEIKEAGIYIRK